jgi:Fe-S-cluster containining protein
MWKSNSPQTRGERKGKAFCARSAPVLGRRKAEDDPQKLAAVGLSLERKRKTIRFLQPCSCFDGKLCRIYADRPVRCRSFECRLLHEVQDGQRNVPTALKSIEQARRRVKRVRDLLERIDHTDKSLPLSRCCAQTIAQPIDLTASEEQIEHRAELMLAIHELTRVLQRDFLT